MDLDLLERYGRDDAVAANCKYGKPTLELSIRYPWSYKSDTSIQVPTDGFHTRDTSGPWFHCLGFLPKKERLAHQAWALVDADQEDKFR